MCQEIRNSLEIALAKMYKMKLLPASPPTFNAGIMMALASKLSGLSGCSMLKSERFSKSYVPTMDDEHKVIVYYHRRRL